MKEPPRKGGQFGVSWEEDEIKEMRKEAPIRRYKCKPEFALYNPGCYFWLFT